MSEQEENIKDVLDTLSLLAPSEADAPNPASHALVQLKQQLGSEKGSQNRSESNWWRLSAMFKRKYALATACTLLILVVALSFPGVRAAASDFLGLFRVQKFAPISISPEQLAVLEEIADSGLFPGEIEMVEEPGEPQLVESLAKAEEIAGLDARTPSRLGEPDAVYAIGGSSGSLIVNVESSRAIMEAAGADPTLIPDSLDGTAVQVTVYPGISQNWNEGVVLLQAPSPLIKYPEDVDPVALGEALMQFLGMEAAQARRLAESIDWTNTLLLPVPENLASFNEVVVDDASGLALSSLEGNNAAILWQRDGIVYALSGAEVDNLIDIANSLR